MKEVESDKDGWTKVKRKDGSKGLVPTVYLKGMTSDLRKHQLLENIFLPDASTPRQAAPQRPPATNKSPFRAIPRDLNEEILQHPGKILNMYNDIDPCHGIHLKKGVGGAYPGVTTPCPVIKISYA